MQARVVARLNAAYDVLAEGKLEDAIRTFKAVLAESPDNIDAMMGIVVALDSKDPPDIEEALKVLRRALRADEHHATARYNMGLMMHRKGFVADASMQYSRIIRDAKDGKPVPDATLAAALINTGLTLEAEARVAFAIKAYRQALTVVEEHPTALAYLGVAMFKEGAPHTVVNELLDRALDAQSTNAPALLGKALIAERDGNFKAAVAHYIAAANAMPDDASGNVWFRAGQLDHISERYSSAVRSFQRARGRTRDIDAKVIHLHLGMALEMGGKLEAAETEYQAACTLDKAYRDGSYRLALVAQKMGKLSGLTDQLREVVLENPSDVEAKVALATAWLDAGDPIMALSTLESAAKQAPSNYFVQFTLGVSLHRTGSPERARASYTTALSVAPGNVTRVHLNLGLLHATEGRLEEAAASYRRAMDKTASATTFADAGASLAALLLQTGDKAEAASVSRSVLVRDPNHFRALLAMGYTLVASSPDEAVATMSNALCSFKKSTPTGALDAAFVHAGNAVALHSAKDLKTAIEHYTEALSETRGVSRQGPLGAQSKALEVSLLCNYGACLWSAQRLEDAMAQFRLALTMDPKNDGAAKSLRALLTKVKKHTSAAAFYNDGAAQQREGNFEGALHLYKQAVKADPQDAISYYSAGVCCAALGDVEEAVVFLERAIALEPSDATAHATLASLLHSTGEPASVDQAARHYEIATTLDSSLVEAHANLGLLRLQRKEFAEAIPSFRAALAFNPSMHRGHFMLGLALRGAWELADAETELREAMNASPQRDWEAQVALGHTLDALARPEDALAAFLEVCTSARVPRADVADAGIGAGALAQRLGDFEAATDSYNAVLKVDPTRFEALVGLGIIAQAQGNFSGAHKRYTAALRVRPTDEVVAEKLAEVDAKRHK